MMPETDATDDKAEAVIAPATATVPTPGTNRQATPIKAPATPLPATTLAMLAALSGRGHRVVTGVALGGADGTRTALSETDVYFREISRDEALAYWQSGEPCDKAGAYAIQGLGGAFVERIEGSYSGVVGLPVFETVALLNEAGLGLMT